MRTSTRSPASCRRIPAASCDRPAFCTHTNSTSGGPACAASPGRARARRAGAPRTPRCGTARSACVPTDRRAGRGSRDVAVDGLAAEGAAVAVGEVAIDPGESRLGPRSCRRRSERQHSALDLPDGSSEYQARRPSGRRIDDALVGEEPSCGGSRWAAATRARRRGGPRGRGRRPSSRISFDDPRPGRVAEHGQFAETRHRRIHRSKSMRPRVEAVPASATRSRGIRHDWWHARALESARRASTSCCRSADSSARGRSTALAIAGMRDYLGRSPARAARRCRAITVDLLVAAVAGTRSSSSSRRDGWGCGSARSTSWDRPSRRSRSRSRCSSRCGSDRLERTGIRCSGCRGADP